MAERSASHTQFYELDSIECTPGTFPEDERQFLEKLRDESPSLHSLEELMSFFFDISKDVFPSDRLSLAFVRDAGRRMVTLWVQARYGMILLGKGSSAELERTSLHELLQMGSARITNDLEEYYREHPNSETSRMLVDEGIRSTMAFPISVDRHVVGFIFHSSTKAEAYDEGHIRLQRAVSHILDPLIEKAYRLDQLAEANTAYMEMLGFVAHEIKSPLASIILDAKIMHDAYIGPLTDEQKSKLEKIIQRATYLMDLVKDYLDLARIEGGKIKMHLLDNINFLKDIVQPGIDIVTPQAMEKKIQIDVEEPEEPLKVQCDPELMRIAVLNLLDNAVKYGREGGSVVITLREIAQGVFISIWNEGPGFSQKQSDKLFRRFSRLNTRQAIKQKGTGLGLYTTWRILKLHNGKIEARSEEGLWAEFVIRLPQPISSKLPDK